MGNFEAVEGVLAYSRVFLHQVTLFSHYLLTELSKEQLFLVEILQPAFQGVAPSRCHPFFCAQQSNIRNVFLGAW